METSTSLNPELQGMVNEKKLTNKKIKALVRLKKIVDRLATVNFVSEEEAHRLQKKFGAAPDIITWGDYFQTEIAEAHRKKTDVEFDVIVNTITFDLIASILIFTGKPKEFFEQVEQAKLEVQAKPFDDWHPLDEDALHLGILKNYFEEMHLDIENLNAQDFSFFRGYATISRAS